MLSPDAPDSWQAFTHSKGIMHLTYSQDGKYLFTVGRNEIIYQIPILAAKSSDWKTVLSGETGHLNAGLNDKVYRTHHNDDDDSEKSEDEMDLDENSPNLIMGLEASVCLIFILFTKSIPKVYIPWNEP